MKRLLIILGCVLGILLIAAAAIPFLIPSSVYRAQIESAASDALGRQVSLEGDVSLSIFPQISARVGGVRVANPEGFARENMIEASQLRGVVRWGPLLSRRVEVAEIGFVDADVMLERRADGATNWTFGEGTPAPTEDDPTSGGGLDAGVERASLTNARLVYVDATSDVRYQISELDMTASLQSLNEPLDLDASGLFQNAPFDVDLTLDAPQAVIDGAPAQMRLALGVDGGDAGYDGALTLGEAVLLDGTFSLDARNLTDLAALVGVDLPYNLAAVGRARASGTVRGDASAPEMRFDTLSIGGNGLDLGYTGAVDIGEEITLSGKGRVDSRNLNDWLTDFGMDAPAAIAILETISFNAQMEGPLDALSLTDIRLSQSGDLLSASYTGALSLAGDGRMDGMVDASSTELRTLLTRLGVELAPGDTLDSFSLGGNLAGSLSRIDVRDLNAELDDVVANGGLTFDLGGQRPTITGTLETGVLDLSPFLGEEGDGGGDGGWSDAPLDLAGLKSVDTDISLTAQRIILGDITLDAPDLRARLTNGDLIADVNALEVFGGDWGGEFRLLSSGAVPEMRLNMDGTSIQLASALDTLAGLGALSGVGQLNVNVGSSGNSLKALVEGLGGDMGTQLSNGTLKGINVGQLVRSRENIVEALASGDLALALAPEAETDFTSMIAGLSLDSGVARLDAFRLVNPILTLEGSGTIDLGARTLDVGIVPTLDTSGQASGSALQLNGVPIPFRIRGDWMSPGLAPDMQLLQSIVAQDVTNRVRDEIRDEIGDELGGVLGGVLGGRRGQDAPVEEAPAETQEDAPADRADPAETPVVDDSPPTPEEQPKSLEEQLEDRARDEVRGALGDLFGRRDRETEPEPEAEPQPER